MVRITNVVATAQLGCCLDLASVEAKLPLAQYLPLRFSGLLLRQLKPYKAHCQLYKNGKITVNGAKSIPEAEALVERFTAQLRSISYVCDISNFEVVNIVASSDFHKPLALSSLCVTLRTIYNRVEFTPEIFPGLSVRLSTCTAVIFHSGKVYFLGAEDILDVHAAFIELYSFI